MEHRYRVETEEEIQAYLQNLHYALDHGANILFQARRAVDEKRDEKYTNMYTIRTLFPDENPKEALKKQLKLLTAAEYIRTVKDLRFPKKSEMREFGKVYNCKDEVYIKIRVELFGNDGRTTTFVMSFHFAEHPFDVKDFPYRK